MSDQLQTRPAGAVPDARNDGRRLGSPVTRGLLWTTAIIVFLVGAALAVAGVAQGRDYFTTASEPLRSDTAAMVTREVDVEGQRPTDPQNDPGDLARVRIQVRQADPNKPVFVGIAKRADVERYLRGTSYDEMSTFEMNPLRVTWQRHPGQATAPAPRDQTFWAATSKVTGPGQVELQWDKSLGEWMAVVMNADGSPGIDIEANIGLRFGFLLPAGIVALAFSLGLSGLLLFARVRRTDQHSDQPKKG